MRRILGLAALIVLSACTQGTSVSKIGDGVYSVSAKAPSTAGGTLAAKKRAYYIAQQFCHVNFKKDASLLEVTFEDARKWPAESAAEISFGCVDDGDPLLKNNGIILMSDEERASARDNKDPFAELEGTAPAKPFD